VDNKGKHHKKLVHLVQKQGQQSQPLVELRIEAGKQINVQCSLIYPADCTPPQVLTVTAK